MELGLPVLCLLFLVVFVDLHQIFQAPIEKTNAIQEGISVLTEGQEFF
jgi:hypothetical protein